MPKDLLLDTGFDLQTANGDFVVGDAARQHQNLLLLTGKGEIRDLPLRGVGIQDFLLGNESPNGEIKRQFEADGMTVSRIAANGTKLEIVATYDADSNS